MTIIDVRTREEFMGGHVANSINIPLNELENRTEEFKQFQKPIILCCLSGGRSGQATAFLNSKGIECKNGGSWFEVNNFVNNN